MIRPICLIALLTLGTLQGCATSPQVSTPAATLDAHVGKVAGGPSRAIPVGRVAEVPVEPNAPAVEGHPLTSVVVTQCNLIVAVYMTMQDGRLLRFDQTTAVPADELMSMAYSATRSERVEVSCNDTGASGYERHDPV